MSRLNAQVRLLDDVLEETVLLLDAQEKAAQLQASIEEAERERERLLSSLREGGMQRLMFRACGRRGGMRGVRRLQGRDECQCGLLMPRSPEAAAALRGWARSLRVLLES